MNESPHKQSVAEARAEYEAKRAENRALREGRLVDAFPEGDPGRWLSALAIVTTGAFAVVTLLGAIDPERFIGPFFVGSVALFGAGFLIFMWVLWAMALRSRDDVLSVAGVFFLAGSAPRSTQRVLLGTFAVQAIVAVSGAAARPFTPLAVGTLVPLFGLSLTGLWAVRYGHFEPHGSAVGQ